MPAVEKHAFIAADFQFIVNGAGHNIPGSQAQPFIILLHELLALDGLQYASESTQRLSDQKGRPLFGII